MVTPANISHKSGILRPTVLFGKEDVLINNIACTLRHLPVFGVFGKGDYKIQPVYVNDLADLAVKYGKENKNTIIYAIRKRIISVYNKKGHSCFQNKQYEEAIKYFELSISFDPENAYAFYGKGMAHFAVGYENEDSDLMEEAETDFLNTLEIDPEN